MPTGYTDAIKDGISFEKFAMNCARGMGACVTLRDDTGGGERIPDKFEPSDYHLKEAQKAKDRLASLEAMSSADIDKEAGRSYDRKVQGNTELLQESSALRDSYDRMLAAVDAWEPPTPKHVNFKIFMQEQIKGSIDFDCYEDRSDIKPVRQTGEEWFAFEVGYWANEISYHNTKYAEEVERCERRTAWIKALRESLKGSGHGS